MRGKIGAICLAIMLTIPVALFAGGSSSNSCATQNPVVLAHGMGAQAQILYIIDYWGDIPDAIEDEGGEVYVTSVNAVDGTAAKAADFRNQVLAILAISGASRVNIIGHSHGTLYSRYAISNLSLAANVASHTSIGGPHRGSALADVIMGVIPDSLEWLVGDLLELAMVFIMGDSGGDAIQNGYDLTRSNMQNVFNPNTPDMPGIYYQSWASSVTNPIAAGLLAPTWAIMLIYEGANDGLVAVTSAKWGNYRGIMTSSWWFGGVNHMAQCVKTFGGDPPGFECEDFFVDVVSELKDMGY